MHNQYEYRNRQKSRIKLSEMDTSHHQYQYQYQTIPNDEELGSNSNHEEEREMAPEWRQPAILICSIASSMALFATLICIFVLVRKRWQWIFLLHKDWKRNVIGQLCGHFSHSVPTQSIFVLSLKREKIGSTIVPNSTIAELTIRIFNTCTKYQFAIERERCLNLNV